MSKKTKHPIFTKKESINYFEKYKLYIVFSLLAIFIVIAFLVQLNFINKLNRLPAPLFGGDHYYQAGVVEHLRAGGKFMDSSSLSEGMPAYLPGYGGAVAIFANLFNLPTIKAMLIFSLILLIASYLVWFILFKKIFNNYYIALFGTVLINSIVEYYSVIILKYTEFTRFIIVPLFILFLFNFYLKKNILNSILLGIIYGILSFSHSVGFMGATLILLFFAIYEFISWIIKKEFKKYLKTVFIFWIIFAIVGGIISLIYWYKPVFVNHLDMSSYDRGHMDTPDFYRPDVQFKFIGTTITSSLFNFTNYRTLLISLLSIIGIIFLIINKIKDLALEFVKLFLFGCLFANFSYFITEPIFHFNIIPTYVLLIYTSIAVTILSIYAIFKLKNNHDELMVLITLTLILSLFIWGQIQKDKYYNTDQWMLSIGKNEFYPEYNSLEKYLKENLTINDVVVTSKELGFAINSISGIKLISGRWAHNGDPYSDLPQKETDLAIILYGDNLKYKKELLKKYNSHYLYWDYRWISQEFIFDEKGNLLDYSDPLMTLNKDKYKTQLINNNVKFIEYTGKIDPTVSSDEYRKFDLLIISPENYRSAEKPWNENLDESLEEVWSHKQNGQKIAILYKLKLE